VSRIDDRSRWERRRQAADDRRKAELDTRIDHTIERWQRRARVTSVTVTAILTVGILLVLSAVVVISGGDSGETQATKRFPVTTNTSSRRPADESTTVPPSGAAATSPPERPATRSERTDPADDSSDPASGGSAPAADPSPSTAPPDDATPPAITAISITAPDPEGVCTASWTADDGGTPIKEYVVSRETVVTPPATAPAPTDGATPDAAVPDPATPTEVVDEKTKDAFTDAPLGASLTVTARNAVGTSEPTEPVVCGS
jgi:hypothetical protein